MILNRNGIRRKDPWNQSSFFIWRVVAFVANHKPASSTSRGIYLLLLFEYESNITVNKVGEVSLLGVRGELVFFLVGFKTEDDIFCRCPMLRSEAEALSVFVSIFGQWWLSCLLSSWSSDGLVWFVDQLWWSSQIMTFRLSWCGRGAAINLYYVFNEHKQALQ